GRATTRRQGRYDRHSAADRATPQASRRAKLPTEEVEQRARRLRLAALRPSRLLTRHPGEDVEMGEALGLAHEAFQEQRGDDRAGKGPFGDVIHVGDRALEQLVVRRPER